MERAVNVSFCGEWDYMQSLARDIVLLERVQDKDELRAMRALFSGILPESYLEIGSSFGLTLCMFPSAGTRIVCVDFCDNQRAENLLDLVATDYGDITIHKANSHDPATIKKVQESGPYDAVFIDAGHTYDDVKQDYENYGHLATKLLLFHDIQQSGVRKFWDEIGGGLEIINKGSTKGYGVRFV